MGECDGVDVAGGSELTVNNLLLAVEYPEDTSTKREEFAYNCQGETIQKKDQNGIIHQYDEEKGSNEGVRTQKRFWSLDQVGNWERRTWGNSTFWVVIN
ncbi:MAG: hypothetical protein MI861_10230 [Pirellulales bacterium]|nr:hypothetical protein [Pirellulales bacterium]